MRIRRLQIENLRNLRSVALDTADARVIQLVGPNGAGKTSVLEALALLARGRSFRASQVQDLIGPAAEDFTVYVEASRSGADNRAHRLAISRGRKTWRGRINGADVQTLTEYATYLPVVVIEPGSHELVGGSPDHRRRYLDWGVFHVKPDMISTWRRFRRALKQRNTALRQSASEAVLDALDHEFLQTASAVDQLRRDYVQTLVPRLEQVLASISPDLADMTIQYRSGWVKDQELETALSAGRPRDRELGNTQSGPHRADLLLTWDGYRARGRLSRGQEKAMAAALLLSQAKGFLDHGTAPLLLLDDLASEFDQQHIRAVFESAKGLSAQLWITGVAPLQNLEPDPTVFHVKQGEVSPAP